MARTKAQWKATILGAMGIESSVSEVTSTSGVAEWNTWADVVAFCLFLLDGFFDFFKADVNKTVAEQKPHTRKWYETVAKAFQLGYGLNEETGIYDVIDTDAQIITNAAVVEMTNKLRIKVAKRVGGILAPLTDPDELAPFKAYMHLKKDAGVPLLITSGNGDDLRVSFIIYYNAMVINAAGQRVDGTNNTPVKGAINKFISELDFNSLFVINRLISAIEAVDGVVICRVIYCAARYGALPYSSIAYEYMPDAGYLVLDDAYFTANTTYSPHIPI